MTQVDNKLKEAVQFIRQQTEIKPRVAIVLGSGLGAFVDEIQTEAIIPYSEIPHFKSTAVAGHTGRLVFGHVDSVPLALLQGRVHFYEGYTMDEVVFPVRTLAMLGTEILILTNSAGGLDPAMKPGDFMIIEDHINLMGDNPLRGQDVKNLGPRFPDLTEAYDKGIRKVMADVMEELSLRYSSGVYCGVSGPTYETPAEVRFLQKIGGKAVGMSTVPESIAANHMGLRVGALSCITNAAAGISPKKLTHQEVTEMAKSVEKSFCDFLKKTVTKL
jgi:purine-nucleoside phosphorylase